ncbi:MAG: hypothetical protein QOE54_2464 [Streptosporangiaceae bacterium]|nr:hypothetical protein [Streptosporangiaceae bacterium]MDX6430098.1 hypothetical protein [Streptosporangiaceae bacterium]
MLTHGLLGDVEVRCDLAGGEFIALDQLQYVSPMRIGEGAQHGIGT